MKTGHAYLKRSLERRLIELFEQFPVVVVSGARQVGKSTLLDHLFGDRMPRIVLDPVRDIEGARSDPDLFLTNRKPPIILDEIQYAPELTSAIKRRLEGDRSPSQYLLSGSQQWQVLKNLQESLAGRVAFLDLDGFSLSEINQCTPKADGWLGRWLHDENTQSFQTIDPLRFNLLEQIWRGFIPETQFLQQDAVSVFLQGYHRTYIERDVREVTEISDLDLFSRFFRLAGALTAQEINHAHLGRELGINPQTASRWLNLLKGTFQWFEVPAFSGNTVKRVTSKPKGFIADTGLACFSQVISTPEAILSHPLWGALFETLVFGEIKKQTALFPTPPAMYHWRSNGGAEVDILLEWNGRFFPIEVKSKSHPEKRDARGLKAFRSTYPHLDIAKGLIISASDTVYPLDEETLVVPWNVFSGK